MPLFGSVRTTFSPFVAWRPTSSPGSPFAYFLRVVSPVFGLCPLPLVGCAAAVHGSPGRGSLLRLPPPPPSSLDPIGLRSYHRPVPLPRLRRGGPLRRGEVRPLPPGLDRPCLPPPVGCLRPRALGGWGVCQAGSRVVIWGGLSKKNVLATRHLSFAFPSSSAALLKP